MESFVHSRKGAADYDTPSHPEIKIHEIPTAARYYDPPERAE